MINLNNSYKYYTILWIHLFICFCLIFGWIIPSKIWLEFLILASVYIQTMYGMFKGCICTRLERKYDRKKRSNSIVDPIASLLKVNSNRTNIDL